MKLAFFDEFRLGVVRDDNIFDVHDAVAQIPRVGPQDLLRGVIEGWDHWSAELDRAADNASPVPLTDVRLRPPVPRPVNIDCMGQNYMEGRTEGLPPGAFLKSPNSIIGPGDTMVCPDVPAGIFEGEAELGVIIGRRASNVPASEAMDYVFGYTCGIDVSARMPILLDVSVAARASCDVPADPHSAPCVEEEPRRHPAHRRAHRFIGTPRVVEDVSPARAGG